MLKKCISVFLALIMVFGAFAVIPFPAFAATSGTTGDCTWTLSDDGVLTISGNGEIGYAEPIDLTTTRYAYYETNSVSNTMPWGNSVTNVIIENGVTRIGYNVFTGLNKLTSVTIADTVTDIETAAFFCCKNLTEIYIPSSVSKIGFAAFEYCNLKRIVVDSANPVFDSRENCNAIINTQNNALILGCANTVIPDTVTKINSDAFYGCSGLLSIDIPGMVNTIGSFAFGGCTNLKSVTVSESLESIDSYAFHGCTSLKQIIIPQATKIGDYALGYYSDYAGDGFGKLIKDFVIYGYKDSYAEAYAVKNYIPFQQILGFCSNCGECLRENNLVVDEGYPATCISEGFTAGSHCPECNTAYVKQEVIPMTGHTPVIDKGYPATCTEDGLTDGSHCSVCSEVLAAQTVIPKTGHNPVIDKAVDATCQHDGHTSGSHCANCGEVYVATQTIPKKPHTPVVDEATTPDCTHTGLTEGSHCSACGEVIVAQTVINALGHNFSMTPASAPSYFHAGHGEGVQCSRCKEWLIAPDEIPMLVGEGVFCDIDGDEEISSVDVTLLMRWLADMNVPVEIDELWADVDDDGELSVLDVTLIQRWLAGFPSSEHIGALLG